jgi:hypothetical protein
MMVQTASVDPPRTRTPESATDSQSWMEKRLASASTTSGASSVGKLLVTPNDDKEYEITARLVTGALVHSPLRPYVDELITALVEVAA